MKVMRPPSRDHWDVHRALENAELEFQPRVAAARRRIEKLTPVEKVR